MSELPQELLKDLEDKNRAQMKHNWMYSFMPAEDDTIYLVGYCKMCDNTVSVVVPYNNMATTVTRANIPKWGCIPVEEL